MLTHCCHCHWLPPPCRISRALRQMATGGPNSDLARLEQQYFIANGAPPNADLAALLADPEGVTARQAPGRLG